MFCYRVFVEIAKREWPQLWPNLFPRLFEIANSSDLALLVLRRMVEDVATLQVRTIGNCRGSIYALSFK